MSNISIYFPSPWPHYNGTNSISIHTVKWFVLFFFTIFLREKKGTLQDQMCSFYFNAGTNFFWHMSQIACYCCNKILQFNNVQKCTERRKVFDTQSSISVGEANVSRRSRSSRWGIAFGIYQIFLQTFPILYIFSFYVPRLTTTEQINPTTLSSGVGNQKTKLFFKGSHPLKTRNFVTKKS